MARERAFTDQQVIDATNTLLVEGKNINGTSLRNKIGTGRPSALMEAYRALEGEGQILAPSFPDVSEQDVVRQELPPEVSEKLSVMLADVEQLVHQINDHAHYTVEQRLNSAITEANERAANAAKREADSIQEQDKAFEQLEDALETITELHDTIKTRQKESAQLSADLNVARSETKAAMVAVAERDERLSEQLKQVQDIQSKLSKADSDKAKAQGQAESLTKQLNEQDSELKSTIQAHSQLQKQYAKAESLVDSLKAQLEKSDSKAEADKTKYQSRIDTITKQLSEQTNELKTISQAHSLAQKEHASELKEATQTHTKLQKEHAKSEAIIESLTEKQANSESNQLYLQNKIDSLSTELSEFQQKCAKLEGQLIQYQKPTKK